MAMSAPSTYNLTFGEPIAHVIESQGKTYYMQNLSINGQPVMISTDWYRCDGLKSGLDRKPEMIYKADGHVRSCLNAIESEAVRQLKVPVAFIQQQNLNPATVSNESLYRPLYKADYVYSKLARDCVFFNGRRQLIKKEELAYGEYRVVVHVTGIYIGSHAQDDKLATLHLRVAQVQHRPVNVTCLFDMMPGLIVQNTPLPSTQSITQQTPTSCTIQMNTTTQSQEQEQQAAAKSKKGSRKTTKAQLQRQNAVIEAQVQKAAESIPSDFFADLDFV